MCLSVYIYIHGSLTSFVLFRPSAEKGAPLISKGSTISVADRRSSSYVAGDPIWMQKIRYNPTKIAMPRDSSSFRLARVVTGNRCRRSLVHGGWVYTVGRPRQELIRRMLVLCRERTKNWHKKNKTKNVIFRVSTRSGWPFLVAVGKTIRCDRATASR